LSPCVVVLVVGLRVFRPRPVLASRAGPTSLCETDDAAEPYQPALEGFFAEGYLVFGVFG